MIILSVESCFLFITFDDMYLMKDVMNIYMTEFLDVSDSIYDFDDEWYRIVIFDGHPIEGSIIHAEMQAVIWFLNK